MFLPDNVSDHSNAEELRKAAFKKIEAWSLSLIPEPLREGVTVSIQEVQCGDPQCSPIDTAIAVVYDRYVYRKKNDCLAKLHLRDKRSTRYFLNCVNNN